MKILLINPPFSVRFNPEMSVSYPLGLVSLAAVLEKKGYEVKIFDFLRENNWKKIRNRIKNYTPYIVGIKCDSDTRLEAFRLAKLCKTLDKSTKVIFGGPHSTVLYEQVLQNSSVDVVIIGEAEHTIVELVQTFHQNKDLRKVKGIAFMKNNHVIKNQPRQLIQNLDSLPLPAYHLLDLKLYADKRNNYDFHIMTSRGCPFSCQFCNVPVVWGSKFRAHSAKRVIEEINLLKSLSSKFKLYMHDDYFDLRSKRNIELFREIIKEKIDIEWTIRTRVDCVDYSSLRNVKKAGLEKISYGIESGSPKILKTINKKITTQQIIDVFKWTKKAGIIPTCTLVIGNPGETTETLMETKKLIKIIKPAAVYNHSATIFPGTPLEQLAIKQGIFSRDYWLSNNSFAPVYTGAMSKERIMYYRRNFCQPFSLRRWMYNLYDKFTI